MSVANLEGCGRVKAERASLAASDDAAAADEDSGDTATARFTPAASTTSASASSDADVRFISNCIISKLSSGDEKAGEVKKREKERLP